MNATSPPNAAARATQHLLALQQAGGPWEGEMDWCPLILAQAVIVRHVLNAPLSDDDRAAALVHFDATARQDGSFGLHAESHGYVLVTALVYIAMRLCGRPKEDARARATRAWLRAEPNRVLAIPAWGKQWLAMLGLYDWSGVPPCPPELFALPASVPFHPRRWYCHTRHIYAALALLYGGRHTWDLGDLLAPLRSELYGDRAATLDFAAHRHVVAVSDLYEPRSRTLCFISDLAGAACDRLPSRVRSAARATCLRFVEDALTESRGEALSPVSGLLFLLALHASDPQHPLLPRGLAGLERWRWQDAALGLRYVGARSQTWDTAFATEALLASPQWGAEERVAALRAHACLRGAQMTTEDQRALRTSREPALGGFCFNDGAHRWPVSDCTAEALTALLGIENRIIDAQSALTGGPLPDERVREALAFLYSRQNDDGGFGSYERRLGPRWLDAINPSEMFGACMSEGSYIECTASALTAFAAVRRLRPQLCDAPLLRRAERARDFLLRGQKRDGSWAGFWGIHHTYGTFHALRGLRSHGVGAEAEPLRRAAGWLARAQNADGGYGENWRGCLTHEPMRGPSAVVQSAWALLSLCELGAGRSVVATGAAAFLARMQHGDGSFPTDSVNGVFFGAAMLTYRLYPSYFPAWALNRWTTLTAA